MTLPLCQHCGEKPVMRQGAKYCTYVCRQTAKYIRKIAALGLQEAECADCGRTFKFKVSAKYCGPCVTRRKKMQNPNAGRRACDGETERPGVPAVPANQVAFGRHAVAGREPCGYPGDTG